MKTLDDVIAQFARGPKSPERKAIQIMAREIKALQETGGGTKSKSDSGKATKAADGGADAGKSTKAADADGPAA